VKAGLLQGGAHYHYIQQTEFLMTSAGWDSNIAAICRGVVTATHLSQLNNFQTNAILQWASQKQLLFLVHSTLTGW
jgi:uncharacterized membrane protein